MMKKVLFILLITFFGLNTFIFGQPKLDKFESEIQTFEHTDSLYDFNPKSVLFVGSSSIRRWETLSSDMAPIPVINRGFGGSTIPEVIYYADRIILPYHPKLLILYCGENDLANDNTKARQAVKSFKKFSAYMNKNLPETKVFFISIKPSISRVQYWTKMQEANAKIKKIIEQKANYYYVDVASKMLDNKGVVLQDIFVEDNLHLNTKGYAIWSELLKPTLEKHYLN